MTLVRLKLPRLTPAGLFRFMNGDSRLPVSHAAVTCARLLLSTAASLLFFLFPSITGRSSGRLERITRDPGRATVR